MNRALDGCARRLKTPCDRKFLSIDGGLELKLGWPQIVLGILLWLWRERWWFEFSISTSLDIPHIER